MSRSRRPRRGGSNDSFLRTIIVIVLIAFCIMLARTSNPGGGLPESNIDEYDAACFVVGNVANSPVPNFLSEKKIIEAVFNNTEKGEKPNICMYSAVENPESIEISKKFLSEKGQNQSAIKSQAEDLARGINETAKSSPTRGGADYFEAIMRAASYLEGVEAEKPIIIVWGSGLSDTGVVDFAFGGLLGKNDDYIKNKLRLTNIRENGYSNISLKWLAAGQPIETNEQKGFSANWTNKVRNIYESALGYVGIKPNYKSVESSEESVDTEYAVAPTTVPGELKPGITISLNERIARFEPDLPTLKNYDEVKEKLTGFANEFNNTDGISLRITGYQTYCARSKELSINRAGTIRDILVNELNVNASRIKVDGVAGPPDNREENPRCGETGIATEHRTVILEILED